MQPLRPTQNDRDVSRVHWMELFFDLIFVALVGQLAHGLHAEPSIPSLFLFLALFASVWWSWVNLTFAINIMPDLSRRQLSLVMLAAMVAVAAIAVAAPEATADRAWLFAAGNALLRVVLLGLWVSQRWFSGSHWRILLYNGGTAVIWFASIWVAAPVNFVLWAIAIALEVVLLIASMSSWGGGTLERVNVEHLTERFGLLVIIVLGESVLSIVTSLSNHWSWESGLTAVLALAVTSLLAWSFFLYSADAMREGLDKLQKHGDFRAIRDTVGFLPFLLVAGVTVIAGAIAVAIEHPNDPLPLASGLSLGGGIMLFYLANAVISWRFGTSPGHVIRWAAPAVVLPFALIFVSAVLPAVGAVACAVAILAFVVASTEVAARRRRANVTSV